MCQGPLLGRSSRCAESRALDFCSGGVWNKTSREKLKIATPSLWDCSVLSPSVPAELLMVSLEVTWGVFPFTFLQQNRTRQASLCRLWLAL